MLSPSYKKKYRDIFREVLGKREGGFYDECALPSYAHGNPVITWLFWKRIEAALTLAEDPRDKSVLDFGCGGGVTFQHLAERHCEIVGCDNQFYVLARDICARLGIAAEIHRDLSEIEGRKFDVLFALDVLEHVDDLDHQIDAFLKLSHGDTKIVVSGPTESLLYRAGRVVIGYHGRYHKRNIYDIESVFEKKGLRRKAVKSLYYPIPLFRVSLWSS